MNTLPRARRAERGLPGRIGACPQRSSADLLASCRLQDALNLRGDVERP